MNDSKSDDESVSDSQINEPVAFPVGGQGSTPEAPQGGSALSSQGKKMARLSSQEVSHEEDTSIPDGQRAEGVNTPEKDVSDAAEAKNADGQVEDSSPEETKVLLKGYKNLRAVVLIVVIIIGLLGFFLVSGGHNSVDLTKVQGNVALSEQELRDIVSSNHLTAYWAGPVVGDKYTIVATTPGLVYIKYLPGGVGVNDTKTPYRTVGTYVWKSAFAVAQYMGTTPGHAGLVNADGNALFYATAVGTRNVYLGIKGKDIQVEVFDPVAGEALGLALVKNGITQIK